MKFKATHNRIVVRRDTAERATKSGIYLPNSEEFCQGTVVSIGPGVYNSHGGQDPVCVVEGDRVLYNEPDSVEIVLDGEVYSVMPDVAVMLVLEK